MPNSSVHSPPATDTLDAVTRATSILEQVTKMSGVGGWELQLDPQKITWTRETRRIHEVPADYEPDLAEAIKFYDPDHREIITEAVESAIATGKAWDLELKLTTAKNRKIWVHSIGSPVYRDGKVTSLIGAFQNVTKRKADDDRIRASEVKAHKRSEELRAILDNMGEGVSVFDKDENLVIWNNKYIEIFGRPPGEVQFGVPFETLIAAEVARGSLDCSAEDYLTAFRHQLTTRRTFSRQIRTQTGKIINAVHSALPTGGWVGTHTDITDQITAAERARSVLQTAVDAIIVTDESGTILEFNPAAAKLFGYSAEEFAGKNIRILMQKDVANNHHTYLSRFNAPAGHKVNGRKEDLVGVRKDGSTFLVEISVSVTDALVGREFTGVLRDVTEQRQMDQMKNQFVSNVNHELRTPLTAIRGSLGLLKVTTHHLLDDKSKRLLDLSVDGCNRLSNLVNDILDMEKITAGKMDYYFEVVEIGALVKDVVERHMNYAEVHQVDFLVHPPEEKIYCKIDQSRFNQALVNLLSNAAKFSHSGGLVTFTVARHAGDTVRISVSDSGPGISPDFAPKVFEKFSQADSSSTRMKGGSGLGLAITRDIVQAFDGTVDFTSTLGAGSTFWIDLPIVPSQDLALDQTA